MTEPTGICPYNPAHRILLYRMPGHILKCIRNYRGPPLAICKYNATHRLLPEKMDDHLMECADYQKFSAGEIQQKALESQYLRS